MMTIAKKVITIDQLQVLADIFPNTTIAELIQWLNLEELKEDTKTELLKWLDKKR